MIGFDKQEIIDLSEKIGTYETSIQPYEDCCTIFVAKHPVTRPNINVIRGSEKRLGEKMEELVREALILRSGFSAREGKAGQKISSADGKSSSAELRGWNENELHHVGL